MYRAWYWALIERDLYGSFIARLHDIPEVAATGASEKEAVESLKVLASDYVRQLVESGNSPPRASQMSEIPSGAQPKEFGRSLISVEMARASARPNAKSNAK